MKRSWVHVLSALLVVSCREADAPLSPGGGGYLHIASDPPGGHIVIDNQDRRRVTPDTIYGLSGRHALTVWLDSAGDRYSYSVSLDLRRDSVLRVNGPLMLSRCTTTCGAVGTHTPHRVRFTRSAAGPLFYKSGTSGGLLWPWSSGNSYSANGLPVFGALMAGRDAVSLGIYDLSYLVGRPFPRTTQGTDWFSLRQSFWVLPPALLQASATVRGIEVQEEVIGRSSENDVLLVRVMFRNVTNREIYQATDPYMPAGGVTFQKAFVGFALDADVGTADDDLFTYAPDLDAVIMYDAGFRENDFLAGYNTKPAMVGLRLIDAPIGAKRVLNGWSKAGAGAAAGDWAAGTASEAAGYEILNGTLAQGPNHPSDRIGHIAGATPGDYRLAVSAGPVDLAPGDSATITVAVALADPVPGTFATGTVVDSGEPTHADRPIMRAAAALLDKLRAAAALR